MAGPLVAIPALLAKVGVGAKAAGAAGAVGAKAGAAGAGAAGAKGAAAGGAAKGGGMLARAGQAATKIDAGAARAGANVNAFRSGFGGAKLPDPGSATAGQRAANMAGRAVNSPIGRQVFAPNVNNDATPQQQLAGDTIRGAITSTTTAVQNAMADVMVSKNTLQPTGLGPSPFGKRTPLSWDAADRLHGRLPIHDDTAKPGGGGQPGSDKPVGGPVDASGGGPAPEAPYKGVVEGSGSTAPGPSSKWPRDPSAAGERVSNEIYEGMAMRTRAAQPPTTGGGSYPMARGPRPKPGGNPDAISGALSQPRVAGSKAIPGRGRPQSGGNRAVMQNTLSNPRVSGNRAIPGGS